MSSQTKTKTDPVSSTENVVPPPVEHGELVRSDVYREPSFSQDRPPVWDTLNDRQKALLKALSPLLGDHELAQAVELAAAYKLDPYTSEIWFTKSKNRDGSPGKLLIMVGRDGLRKIVQHNRLEMTCDAVYSEDEFSFELLYDENGYEYHKITHKAKAFNRGELLGAWARVYERGTRIERGFFAAPIGEYKPKNVSDHSPWAKQTSVMVLAAAERQAARQATPLGGLLIVGEDEVINSTAVEVDAHDKPVVELAPEVQAVAARARKLGYGGWDEYTLSLTVGGQPEGVVKTRVAEINAELDEFERTRAQATPDTTESPVESRPRDWVSEARAIKASMEQALADGDEQAYDAAVSELEQLREARDQAAVAGDETARQGTPGLF